MHINEFHIHWSVQCLASPKDNSNRMGSLYWNSTVPNIYAPDAIKNKV